MQFIPAAEHWIRESGCLERADALLPGVVPAMGAEVVQVGLQGARRLLPAQYFYTEPAYAAARIGQRRDDKFHLRLGTRLEAQQRHHGIGAHLVLARPSTADGYLPIGIVRQQQPAKLRQGLVGEGNSRRRGSYRASPGFGVPGMRFGSRLMGSCGQATLL